MTAQHTFIGDQTDAAAEDARRIVNQVAAATGARVAEGAEHPVATRLIRELKGRLTFGLIRRCAHLPATAPTIVSWFVWAPEELQSIQCFLERLVAMHGTAEDRRCDGCDQLVAAVTPMAAVAGAVIVSAGLCRPCLTDRDSA